MDSVAEVVSNICRIPIDLHETGTKSVIELLEESGYPAAHGQISPGLIQQYIREHPDLVEEWLVYSCDKRTTGGWYFTKEDNGEFLVDLVETPDSAAGRTYSDPIEACAYFIWNELECVRNHME